MFGKHNSTVLTILIITLLMGCGHAEKFSTPMRLFVGYDCSISADQNNVPQLTSALLDSFIAVVARRGGSINFLPFTSNSNRSVFRLPLMSYANKGLREKAALAEQQRMAIANFKAQLQPYVAPADGPLNNLMQETKQKKSSKRRAERTDIWGAIRRFNMVLQEPRIGPPSHDIGLLVTDGHDDAKRFPPCELQTDHIFTVGMPAEHAVQLFGTRTLAFESLTSALRLLQNLPVAAAVDSQTQQQNYPS